MRLPAWRSETRYAIAAWSCGIASAAIWILYWWVEPQRPKVFHAFDPLLVVIGLVLLIVSSIGVLAASSALGQKVFEQPRRKQAVVLALLALILNVVTHPWIVLQADKWRNTGVTEQARAHIESQRRAGGFQRSGQANVVVFSPDGETLASALGNDVQLWEVVSGKMTAALRGHRGVVTSIAFTPDGKELLTASDDHTVRHWEISQRTLKHTFERQRRWISSVAVSSDGLMVAFGGEEGVVKIWDLKAGQERRSFVARVGQIRQIAFSPVEVLLAVAGEAAITLCNPTTGEALPDLPDSRDHFNCISFSNDGQRLVAGGGDVGTPGLLVEWDLGTKQKRAIPHEHHKMLQSLSLSYDGQYLATSAWDKNVLIYELGSGKRVSQGHHAELIRSVAFSPVKHSLAIAGATSIRILNPPFPRDHQRN